MSVRFEPAILCVLLGVAAFAWGVTLDAAAGSIAVGRTNGGSLRSAADALRGSGPVRLLPKVAGRKLHYTTDEMARALHRAAASVAGRHPGGVLMLGNLSALHGGKIPFSVSHQNGLDADLALFMVDAKGRSVPPDDYIHFGADLRSMEHARAYRFDVARNWALARALLADTSIKVQWLFISTALRKALLDHAAKLRIDVPLRERAARVLHQPSDAPAHNDHMHLRLYCPESDRPLGCVDRGPTWPWI